ncbi:hypothetical protein CLOP_g22421 [Closterium sp. NIES-67]|nr:hypothetical protein CLOP_g22421 [Closterium sp. NIES-67]
MALADHSLASRRDHVARSLSGFSLLRDAAHSGHSNQVLPSGTVCDDNSRDSSGQGGSISASAIVSSGSALFRDGGSLQSHMAAALASGMRAAAPLAGAFGQAGGLGLGGGWGARSPRSSKETARRSPQRRRSGETGSWGMAEGRGEGKMAG